MGLCGFEGLSRTDSASISPEITQTGLSTDAGKEAQTGRGILSFALCSLESCLGLSCALLQPGAKQTLRVLIVGRLVWKR